MTTKEAAYSEVEKIVQKFKHTTRVERNALNEHATRQGYILPLFRALGWDIDNTNEVNPEEKVSRGWVDFSFRIGNVPRFYLETKRINEDLNNPEWVRQAIDYAWTKSVTWALLSDFEGLRVFNAELKERNPFQAQFFEFTVDTYLSDFERLWWLSREQTALGRLDIEGERFGRAAKRLPVNQELFDDLKKWRELLFRDLHAYYPILSPGDIDTAILHLLNRLIFIRTAEDRHVEPMRLRPMVRELKDRKQFTKWGAELAKLFRELDEIYNSELFAKHFSDGFEITPADLENVIDGLYEKQYIKYNFNAIEADVLGTVYEQYLGSVVAEKAEEERKPKKVAEEQPALLSEGMTVQERRAKRKSQGIYYTPSFVTKYIVQQTVGRYLDEHGYDASNPPHILDMACGSGSFLIDAFDVTDDFVAKQRGYAHKDEITPEDQQRQIETLNNCIFGVDKDKQAVEVARLNLLLRALHSRKKLPMLNNIVHGDSLHPETFEVNFPQIMRAGGFDVIIGNPPYVRQETLGEEFKTYAKENFETYAGTADLYIYFIEQAHKLLKPGGYFGMIVSNKWMRANYGKALREFLTKNAEIMEIIDFGELPVFENAATFPVIIITKKRQSKKQRFLFAPVKRLDFASLSDEVKSTGVELDERAVQGDNWTLSSSGEQAILDKMRKVGIPLSEYVNGKVFWGIKTGYNEAFVINEPIKKRLLAEDKNSQKLIRPFVIGDDVRKYHINYSGSYLIRIPKGFTNENIRKAKSGWNWLVENYPAVARYLKPHETSAEKRQDKGDYWWELRACDYYAEFDKPKIVYPEIARESRFAFDTQGLYLNNKTFFIPSDDPYLLGLLNSKIIWLFLKRTCSVLGDPDKGGRLELRYVFMKQLPIRRIDFRTPAEKAAHDGIVKLVEKMLTLQKERQAVRPEDDLDRTRQLDRQIQQVDEKIDEAVFELYGLTDEEKKTVMGAGK